MEEKQRGEGVEREMVQLWGNKTTQRHLTCGGTGGGVGVKAAGAAHSGIVIRGRGGWDAADKVERNGSFLQILPLGSFDTKHSCCCSFKLRNSKRSRLNHETDSRSKFHKCFYYMK